MDAVATLLDETLDAWTYARTGFRDEAANLPPGEWGFRPTPENRSVAELVLHILESAEMAVGELARPDGDFRRQSFADHVREHTAALPGDPSPGELLRLLDARLEDGVARLRQAGEARMMEPIRQFNGEPARRLTWFHHHIAHEEYHRGQLALYARLTGRVPALTQRIYSSG